MNVRSTSDRSGLRRQIGRAARRTLAGELPPRYNEPWGGYFERLMSASLKPNVRILDIGSGRRPLLSPAERPSGCHYVGLDISSRELNAAPPGSYDEVVVTDVMNVVPELSGQFDLVVSWQVLEHVRCLSRAVDAMHTYLRPGGRLVALLSGRFAAFGVLNRLIPAALGHRIVGWVMRRERQTIFHAYYDDCYDTAMRSTFLGWRSVEITPRWVGAAYLRFSRVLQTAYVAYEEWAFARHRRNLATHYFVDAVR